MNSLVSILLLSLPAVWAACVDPIAHRASVLLAAAPSALSTTSNFSNAGWIYGLPSTNASGNTRVLTTAQGATLNETLLYSASFPSNNSWVLMWSSTPGASAQSLVGADVDSYTHTLLAAATCDSKTLLQWDAAACVSGNRDVAEGYFEELQAAAIGNLLLQFGGLLAPNGSYCSATSTVPAAGASSGFAATSTDVVVSPTGLPSLTGTGSLPIPTNGTANFTAFPVPTATGGANRMMASMGLSVAVAAALMMF